MESDIIWIDNPIILLKYYNQFYPNNKMTFVQKCNSIVRLILYTILIIILLKLNKRWIIYFIFIIIFITFLGKKTKKNICRESTNDNPMSNLLIGDNLNISACKNKDNKNNLLNNVYQDLNKSFISHYLERTFYTLPETIYPNDNIKLAKSLTNDYASSCKEKNINCNKDLDIRFVR